MTFEGYPFEYSPSANKFIWTYDTDRPVDQVFWDDDDMREWELRLNRAASSMALEQHPDVELEHS